MVTCSGISDLPVEELGKTEGWDTLKGTATLLKTKYPCNKYTMVEISYVTESQMKALIHLFLLIIFDKNRIHHQNNYIGHNSKIISKCLILHQ